MNLDFSPEDLAFRDEVRTFIAQNYPAEVRAKQDAGEELGREDFLAWHRILGEEGRLVHPVLAGGVRRPGLDPDPEVHLRRGAAPAPAPCRSCRSG